MKSMVPWKGGLPSGSRGHIERILGRGPMFPFGFCEPMMIGIIEEQGGGVGAADLIRISSDCGKVRWTRGEDGAVRIEGGPSWIAGSADMVGMAATDALGVPAGQPLVEGQAESAILSAVLDLVGAGALVPHREAPPRGVHEIKAISSSGKGLAYVELALAGGGSFRGLVSVECRDPKPGDLVSTDRGELLVNVSRSCGRAFSEGFVDGFVGAIRSESGGKWNRGQIEIDRDGGDDSIKMTVSIKAAKAGEFHRDAQAAIVAGIGKPVSVTTKVGGVEEVFGPYDPPAVTADSTADVFMEAGIAAAKAIAKAFVEAAAK